MMVGRYSWLAVASVALHLPWLAMLGWCSWVFWTAPGPVAGEIFLLPVGVWFFTGIPAGGIGLVAWLHVRASAGRLRGRWLAALGLALAAAVPALLVAENWWGQSKPSGSTASRTGGSTASDAEPPGAVIVVGEINPSRKYSRGSSGVLAPRKRT
jgi:hypothetical protein